MQGNVAELIRELMEMQQLSVRKVSARIADKYGGSTYGYTQQISRILNDPNYDPSLSTVRKIFDALDVSFWQISKASDLDKDLATHHLTMRLDQMSADLADLKSGMTELKQAIGFLLKQSSGDRID